MYDKTFNTEYGLVNVSIAPSSDLSNDIKYGLANSDCVNISDEELVENTISIDDNPSNTYGLASKVLVLKTMLEHCSDENAHSELFDGLLKKISDLYEKHGKLHAYKISDEHGNVINANGKVILKGDIDNPKYILLSSEKFRDIDKVVQELIDLISDKQKKLKLKENSDLSIDQDGNIDVVNMRYDDSEITNRIKTLEELSIAWTDTSYMVSTSADKWNFAYDASLTAYDKLDSVYTTVNTNSGDWKKYDSRINSATADIYAISSDVGVLFTSGNSWNNTHESLSLSSPNWNSVYTSFYEVSSSIDGAIKSLSETSGNWNSTYTTVNTNSGDWKSAYDSVLSASGVWNDVYSKTVIDDKDKTVLSSANAYADSLVIRGVRFMGTVETTANLPSPSSAQCGDMYNVRSPSGANYVLDISGIWDKLSETYDFSEIYSSISALSSRISIQSDSDGYFIEVGE